jgi:signal transduction histidine kinase
VSGLDQLQYLSWLLYAVIFVAVLVRTIQRPTPAHIDMTLFFGNVVLLIVLTGLTSRLHVPLPVLLTNVTGVAAMALGYLLLRLVRDFSEVSTFVMRTVEFGLLASIVAIVSIPAPLPISTGLLLIGYLILVIAYDTRAFAREASRNRGVTRRRIQAAAAGSLCLVLTLLDAGFGLLLPAWASVWSELGGVLGLASGVCYFFGFAPPTWLRRAWQEPEVRAFLARAASLPRLPDARSTVHELERGAAAALGAPAASIALWDVDTQRLHIHQTDTDWEIDPAARPVVGRAFLEQRARLITNMAAVDPDNAALFEQYNARTVLSAPITTNDKRLGALIVYAPRAPFFADSDLELVQVLADQAAVILENRTLIDEAARVSAREEAARLKEDFLSSAAHDLKTPLTGIVTQAQVLQRRAERNPSAPVDRAGLDRLLTQSLRLKDLVLELLDVSRLEQGGLIGELQDVDLGKVVHDAAVREGAAWQRVQVDSAPPAPVIVPLDVPRFAQVLSNLIENALKYSPHDSPVEVRVWQDSGEARLSVHDRGIGIPAEDQPLVFERFQRARNVDHRRFAGMGLGLYIARGIVQEHGGRIWVQSKPGSSTFFVGLPLSPRRAPVVVEPPAQVTGA